MDADLDGAPSGRGILLGRTETGRVAGIPLAGVIERDITLGSIGVPLRGVSFRDDGGGGRVDGVPVAGVTERGGTLARASVDVDGGVLGRSAAGRGAALARGAAAVGGVVLGRAFTDAGGMALGRSSGVDREPAETGAVGVAAFGELLPVTGSSMLGAGTSLAAADASVSSELPHSSSMSSVVGANDLNDGGPEGIDGLVSGGPGRGTGGDAIASDGATSDAVTGTAPGAEAVGVLSGVPARLLALGFLVFLLIALRRLVLTRHFSGIPRPRASLVLTVAANQPDN